MRSNNAISLFRASIIIGSLIRIYICFSQNPLDYLFSDSARHWNNGGRFLHPDYIGAGDPIVYQLYIYLIRSLLGSGRFPIAVLSATLSVLMPWIYYRAARESGIESTWSLLLWALILWTPSLAVIYHYTMMETLLLVIEGLAVWSTLSATREASSTAWLLTIFLWCLAVLTKATVFPLAVSCVCYLWWKTSKNISRIVSAVMLGFLMLVPSGIRSFETLGFIAPLGSTWKERVLHEANAYGIKIQVGKAHYFFSSPSANSAPLAPFTSWTIERAQKRTNVSVVIDPRRGDADWKQAEEMARQPMKLRVRELLENILLFLFSPSWPDSDCRTWDGWTNFYSRWMWAPLIFILLDCNCREFLGRRFDLIPIAVTSFALFLMFQNVATMEGRYRKPLEPLLLLNLIWILSNRTGSAAKAEASLDDPGA